MIRQRLAPLNESSHATVVVGCIVGAIAGATSTVLAITATSNANFGYVTMLLDNVVGLGVLYILGTAFGLVIGATVGAIEAGASYAFAFIAAERRWSVRFVFTTFGMFCVAVNTTISAACCAAFLGLEGAQTADFAGLAVIAAATLGAAGIFGYAQSLDWPSEIDIREMPESSVRVDRGSTTLHHDGLADSIKARIWQDERL